MIITPLFLDPDRFLLDARPAAHRGPDRPARRLDHHHMLERAHRGMPALLRRDGAQSRARAEDGFAQGARRRPVLEPDPVTQLAVLGRQDFDNMTDSAVLDEGTGR